MHAAILLVLVNLAFISLSYYFKSEDAELYAELGLPYHSHSEILLWVAFMVGQALILSSSFYFTERVTAMMIDKYEEVNTKAR